MKSSSIISLLLAISFGIVAIYYSSFKCYVILHMQENGKTEYVYGLSNYYDFAKNAKIVTAFNPFPDNYMGELVHFSGKSAQILTGISKSEKGILSDYNANDSIRTICAILSIVLGIIFIVLCREKMNKEN